MTEYEYENLEIGDVIANDQRIIIHGANGYRIRDGMKVRPPFDYLCPPGDMWIVGEKHAGNYSRQLLHMSGITCVVDEFCSTRQVWSSQGVAPP